MRPFAGGTIGIARILGRSRRVRKSKLCTSAAGDQQPPRRRPIITGKQGKTTNPRKVAMAESGLSVEKAQRLERLVRQIDKLQNRKATLDQELKEVREKLRTARQQLAAESEGLAPVFQRLVLGKKGPRSKAQPAARQTAKSNPEKAIVQKVARFGQHGFHRDDLLRWFKDKFPPGEVALAVDTLVGKGVLEKDEKDVLRITPTGAVG